MPPTLNTSWIDATLSRLEGKLGIYGSGINKAEAWRDAVGAMDPESFYKTLTRDMPGTTEVMIEAKGGGSSEMNITCKQGRTTLLRAENHIQGNPSTSKIHFEEWRVGDQNAAHPNRGHGLGTVLFANHLDLMGRIGLRYMTLRGGREDGALYWSRRGFRIDERGPYLHQFIQTIGENYNALQLQIKPETRAEIEKILSAPTADANILLARIDDMIDDKKLNRRLFSGTNPRCVVDTQNAMQMSIVRDSLKNVDALRKSLSDSFPENAPAAVPQNGAKPPAPFDFRQ